MGPRVTSEEHHVFDTTRLNEQIENAKEGANL
jgi:hypothetical protein